MRHPDFTALFQLAAGTSERGFATKTEQHLDGCAPCKASFGEARHLFEVVRSDHMMEPPAALVKKSIALWRKEHPGPLSRAINVIRAALVFDSLSSPLPAEVRGQGTGTRSRRMLFSAGDYEIDIDLSRSRREGRGTATAIRGQLLRHGTAAEVPAVSEVSLDRRTTKGAARSTQGRSTFRARTDEHGAFLLGPVSPGCYRMVLEGGGVRLIVDRLDVM